MKDVSLSIILPVYNEENVIELVLREVEDYIHQSSFFGIYEIIVVDDKSTDKTNIILHKLKKDYNNLIVVEHKKNLGYGPALISGIKKAQCSLVLLMDADFQFRINSLDDFVKEIPLHDVLVGYRNPRKDPVVRIIIGKIYNFLALIFLGVRVKDINCGFKLIRREVLDVNELRCHSGLFYANMFINAVSENSRVKEIPVEHYSRNGGVQSGASITVIYKSIWDFFQLILKRK